LEPTSGVDKKGLLETNFLFPVSTGYVTKKAEQGGKRPPRSTDTVERESTRRGIGRQFHLNVY